MPTVRIATDADVPGIFAIYDHEVLHGIATCDTVPRSAAERDAFLRAHDDPSYPLLVASTDEAPREVAGWACLSPWSPRLAYARTCENTVYVRQADQGRGLGRLLMTRLLERAREDGRALVVARIVEGNPASLRLHEALGFETLGRMPGCAEKLGRVLDVRIMGLRLRA